MSKPAGQDIPAALVPKCPHCEEPLVTLNKYSYTEAAWMILTIACGQCNVLLNSIVVPVGPAPEPEDPASNPTRRIHMPS
jgi:hypothetical protein